MKAKNCYLCNAILSFLIFKVNTFRVVFQLKGFRSDTRAFIIIKYIRKHLVYQNKVLPLLYRIKISAI